MERLTHERVNGIKTGYWSSSKKQDLVDRLSDYEDTGLTSDEINALRIGRRYREMTGGDAGEPEEETAGYDMGRLRDLAEPL